MSIHCHVTMFVPTLGPNTGPVHGWMCEGQLKFWVWWYECDVRAGFPCRAQTCGQTNKDFSITLASFRIGKTTSPCNLLDLQFQPPLRALRGFTSLLLAAENGHDAVVQRLLAAGAAVDKATNKGRGLGRGFFGEEVVGRWNEDGKEVDAVENDGHGVGKGILKGGVAVATWRCKQCKSYMLIEGRRPAEWISASWNRRKKHEETTKFQTNLEEKRLWRSWSRALNPLPRVSIHKKWEK